MGFFTNRRFPKYCFGCKVCFKPWRCIHPRYPCPGTAYYAPGQPGNPDGKKEGVILPKGYKLPPEFKDWKPIPLTANSQRNLYKATPEALGNLTFINPNTNLPNPNPNPNPPAGPQHPATFVPPQQDEWEVGEDEDWGERAGSRVSGNGNRNNQSHRSSMGSRISRAGSSRSGNGSRRSGGSSRAPPPSYRSGAGGGSARGQRDGRGGERMRRVSEDDEESEGDW